MKWVLVIIGVILAIVGVIGLVSTGFLSALWSWILLILGVILVIVGLVMKGGGGEGETTPPPA
jgi:hypothetical protein